MTEAREDVAWQRLSHLLALIANCHRDEKRRPRPWKAEDIYRPVGHGENQRRYSCKELFELGVVQRIVNSYPGRTTQGV